MIKFRSLPASVVLALFAASGRAQAPLERAREMGIPLDGAAGPLDAITDVPGVAVGHTTLIAALGIGRMGGIAGAGSGDLFLAFSTAKTGISDSLGVASVRMLDDERIDPVYEATVQATEEAIINALLQPGPWTGANHLRVPALPHDRLRAVLQKYGRLRN